MAGREGIAHAPPVDADEQEQPHDVDEMPVPGRSFEPEMMVRLEMALCRTPQADREEGRTDDHVEAVKTGRHKECRGIDAACPRHAFVKPEAERGMAVLIGLHRGE